MQSAYRHGHSTETTFMNLCSLLTDMVIAQKQHEPMQSAYRHGHSTETT